MNNHNMISTTIEILGKPYPIRCPEEELPGLQQAADLLNQKMNEVKESGKAINLERIAIITALNVTYQLLQTDKQQTSVVDKINDRIAALYKKIENVIQSDETELVYKSE